MRETHVQNDLTITLHNHYLILNFLLSPCLAVQPRLVQIDNNGEFYQKEEERVLTMHRSPQKRRPALHWWMLTI